MKIKLARQEAPRFKLRLKQKPVFSVGEVNVSRQQVGFKFAKRDFHQKGLKHVQADESGYKVTFAGLPDYTFYVHQRAPKFYAVTESSTGWRVCHEETAQMALDKAISLLNAHCRFKGQEAFDEVIAKTPKLTQLKKGYDGTDHTGKD